jgi:hypothetical protein
MFPQVPLSSHKSIHKVKFSSMYIGVGVRSLPRYLKVCIPKLALQGMRHGNARSTGTNDDGLVRGHVVHLVRLKGNSNARPKNNRANNYAYANLLMQYVVL